jgi:hypothetical protein
LNIGPSEVIAHQLPHLVLVEPERVGVAADELIQRQAVDRRRPLHTLLLAVDEDNHELLAPFLPRALLGGGELALSFGHFFVAGFLTKMRRRSVTDLISSAI